MDFPPHTSIDPHTTTADTIMAHASVDQNTAAAARVDSPMSSPKITPTQDKETGATSLSLPPSLNTIDTAHASPLMRLPAELRVQILEHLLLPVPSALVHCVHFCSLGDDFLASTCKPASSRARAYNCDNCAWRGADVHVSIMRTCKQIYKEAVAVLYENVEAVWDQYFPRGNWELPYGLAAHVRTLCFTTSTSDRFQDLWSLCSHLSSGCYPNLKLIRLHVDWDLTINEMTIKDFIYPSAFEKMTSEVNEQMEFVIDVHIERAWDDDSDWAEMIQSRVGNEERAKELNAMAIEARQQLIDAFKGAFEKCGKVLKLRES